MFENRFYMYREKATFQQKWTSAGNIVNCCYLTLEYEKSVFIRISLNDALYR